MPSGHQALSAARTHPIFARRIMRQPQKRIQLAPGDDRELKIGPDGVSKPAVWREFYTLSRLRAGEFHFDRRCFAVAGHFEDKFRHILRGTEVIFDQTEGVNLLRRPGNCHPLDW